MTKFSSPVEVGARYTSGFTKRRWLWGRWNSHAGTDWAPKSPGDTNSPVYAVADGYVEEAGVGVLAGHSGNIIVINHGKLTGNGSTDLTKTNYGHLSRILVRRGQRVKAGQLIGYQGATGNVTGVHLHLGVRFNGTYADPKRWLATKGITPGRTAPLNTYVVVPVGKPSTSTKLVGSLAISSRRVQNFLKNMGYDIVVDGNDGPQTRATVKLYQSSQRSPFTLVADGIFGPKTYAHMVWTGKLQTAMNRWKGKNLNVDGHYGANTVARVFDLMRRNYGGAYKGAIDGIPGRIFCKMLGIPTHP